MQSSMAKFDARRAPRPGEAGAVRIEAIDARADGGRRVVSLSGDRVAIARSLGGVFMTLTLAPSAFHGVVLRLRGLADGVFHFQILLVHRDPDLCVTLLEAEDDSEILAEWRLWAKFLGVPALVEREENRAVPERPHLGAVAIAPVGPRRRGRTVTRRRPRFLTRRKLGGPVKAAPACGRQLFPGSKAER